MVNLNKISKVKILWNIPRKQNKLFSMASHGHFLSFASFPLPLPLLLPEKLNIENGEYKHILNKGPTTSAVSARCLLTSH